MAVQVSDIVELLYRRFPSRKVDDPESVLLLSTIRDMLLDGIEVEVNDMLEFDPESEFEEQPSQW